MRDNLIIYDWDRAIAHIDADAFFASVEQATRPALAGKPVVVGKERGIATAVSYQAKALGVERGMPVFEIRKRFPEVIILESDYEKYSLFSLRMFEVLRRFSPQVEEYSIDEAFMDLTGLRSYYRASYEEIGRRIKDCVRRELGITISVGISLTKTLAKVASKQKKPDGLTVIPGRSVRDYLKDYPIEKVWGIGKNTAAFCHKLGIFTALDFASRPEDFIKRFFKKPYQEVWHELNGRCVYEVSDEPKRNYKSISKVKSFPPTGDRHAVLAFLIDNLDGAFFKARRYGLCTSRISIFLKRNDYRNTGRYINLIAPTCYPEKVIKEVKASFEALFDPKQQYRQTGVVLHELEPCGGNQLNLFEDRAELSRLGLFYKTIDRTKESMGRDSIVRLSSLNKHIQRDDIPRLNIPFIDLSV